MPKFAPSSRAAIIGAGPAGLMAAEALTCGGAQVTVYDRMPSAGRKLLMAGRGGLNLTHSEASEPFLARYGDAAPALRDAIAAFPPQALCAWAEELGQPTFVGSSGRVFPRAMKSSPLLRAWLRRLDAAGVRFAFRHRWSGWDGARLTFETPDGAIAIESDATVLALGGASWPRLGSDGAWVLPLMQAGITVAPLKPANSGFPASWSRHFVKFAGAPLKRIVLNFGEQYVRGEAIITVAGLEGGAIYALSGPLRDAIETSGEAVVSIALRPDVAADELERRLSAPRAKQSLSTFLRKALSLSPAEIGLLQEAAHASGQGLSTLTPAELAGRVNAIPIRLTGIAPIARAISTAGGIAFDELDARFMLRRRKGVFVAGEMLNWDAPTGGYLLQASFATGAAAGRGALAWLQDSAPA
ncbi:MAG: hypothetical protein V7604_2635 [Hyphomicrobiales bacterium]